MHGRRCLGRFFEGIDFFAFPARIAEFPTKVPNLGASGEILGVKLLAAAVNPPRAPRNAGFAPRSHVIPRQGLASISRMSTMASAVLHRSTWLSRLRGRELFVGMGYSITVVFVLMAGWDIDDLPQAIMERGLAQALRDAAAFFLLMMAHQLPTVPLLTVAVNLAPTRGYKRYAVLALVAVSMWAYCTILFYVEGKGDSNSSYALMVVLIVAACVYRSSARSATESFLQKQIEGAALDANVKRARLQLLRAQIEPHFLFNTLATVRALARTDRGAAVAMIDHLMRYLSEALPKLRQEECSLAEELQLIDAYLRIHQIRMGSRMSYELRIPPTLFERRIPTMILLTLVENAVKHGINPAVDGGRISVSALQEQGALVLRVSDSGQGMAATDGHGMGLANIRRRLTILYGDDAVLTLSRPAARGVTASVSIPLAA